MISFSLAKKNIVRKQERSLLTIIGVILAVGCFVALLSISEGLNKRLKSEVMSRNVDLYVLPSGSQHLPTGSIGAFGSAGEEINLGQLLPEEPLNTEAKQEEIAAASRVKGDFISFLNSSGFDSTMVPNIKSAIGVSRFQKTIRGRTVVFWGLPFGTSEFDGASAFSSYLPGMRITNGVFPLETKEPEDLYGFKTKRTAEDLSDAEKVFIAGNKIVEELSMSMERPLILKKDNLSLNLECVVSFNAGFQDYFCYLPIQTAMAIEDSHGKVNEIWIQVEDKSKINETKVLLMRYFPNLEFKTGSEYLGISGDLLKYAWFLQFAIALIGILIATTASMNTMLMSTFERVREFGALRAIGANRSTIALMILIESLILSSIGGAAGIIVGILGSTFLDGAVQAIFQTPFPMANITFNLILYALCLSVLIGVIGAVIPIVLVYRMEIIKALKWDM